MNNPLSEDNQEIKELNKNIYYLLEWIDNKLMMTHTIWVTGRNKEKGYLEVELKKLTEYKELKI